MSKMRKTIKIDVLVEKANNILKSEHSSPEQREAVHGLVSDILMASDAYRGFSYQQSEIVDGKLKDNYDGTRTVFPGVEGWIS